jgi:hypothetical protein
MGYTNLQIIEGLKRASTIQGSHPSPLSSFPSMHSYTNQTFFPFNHHLAVFFFHPKILFTCHGFFCIIAIVFYTAGNFSLSLPIAIDHQNKSKPPHCCFRRHHRVDHG